MAPWLNNRMFPEKNMSGGQLSATFRRSLILPI
jgi:hypothetical protein